MEKVAVSSPTKPFNRLPLPKVVNNLEVITSTKETKGALKDYSSQDRTRVGEILTNDTIDKYRDEFEATEKIAGTKKARRFFEIIAAIDHQISKRFALSYFEIMKDYKKIVEEVRNFDNEAGQKIVEIYINKDYETIIEKLELVYKEEISKLLSRIRKISKEKDLDYIINNHERREKEGVLFFKAILQASPELSEQRGFLRKDFGDERLPKGHLIGKIRRLALETRKKYKKIFNPGYMEAIDRDVTEKLTQHLDKLAIYSRIRQNKLVTCLIFENLGGGRLYAGYLSAAELYQQEGIATGFAKSVFEEVGEKTIIEATTLLEQPANSFYVEELGFVLDGVIPALFGRPFFSMSRPVASNLKDYKEIYGDEAIEKFMDSTDAEKLNQEKPVSIGKNPMAIFALNQSDLNKEIRKNLPIKDSYRKNLPGQEDQDLYQCVRYAKILSKNKNSNEAELWFAVLEKIPNDNKG